MESELDNQLRLARLKVVTDRQQYYTQLSKETFQGFLKVFVGSIAGAVAVFSARHTLDLRIDFILELANWVAWLVTIMGLGCVLQIAQCLYRWFEHRFEESKLNSYAERPKRRTVIVASIFESVYVVVILLAVTGIWIMEPSVEKILKARTKIESASSYNSDQSLGD